MKNDTLIVIPIRMASLRLPGKPLLEINGKAMVAHVWERAILSKCGDVIVACCDKEARDYLNIQNIPYVMTKKKLNSGTDRVYDAFKALLKKKLYKYIINLQGDVPNISPKIINKLRIKIHKAKIVNLSGKPGTVIDDELTIATKKNAIKILKLQKEGKNIVDVTDFLKGNKINKNTILN